MTTLCLHVVTNDGGRNIKESYNGYAKSSQGVENLNEPIQLKLDPLRFLVCKL